jgi:hypothetical protein
MRPLIIMPLDNSSLRNLFMGTSLHGKEEGSAIPSNIASPQFGCN